MAKTRTIVVYPNVMHALGLAPLATDQKTVAERQWRAGSQARKPQAACDIGLFSDDAKQIDLFTSNANKGK